MEARGFLAGLGVVCVFGLLVTAGYSKSEPPKQLALPADLVQLKTEAEKARTQTDQTLVKLDALVATTAGDLAPPYKAYTEAVAKLDADLRAVFGRLDDMKAKGTAYFEAWEKQIAGVTTPEVRELADKRKADLVAKYATLQDAMTKAKDEFGPFITSLKDIQTYLGLDLTANGLQGVGPLVTKAKDAGAKVKENIDTVVKDCETVRDLLSQKLAPAPAAK
jgi:hypothetical protein